VNSVGLDSHGLGADGIRFCRSPGSACSCKSYKLTQHAASVQSYGESLWFGTALIGAGIAMNLFSGWHHARLVRRMNRGQEAQVHSTGLAVATSLFLALVGVAMAIYLISVHYSAH